MSNNQEGGLFAGERLSLLRSLIADDGFAMSFQSLGQYRTALLNPEPETPRVELAVATAIHYPECWDVMTYPSLESALSEMYADFKCSECKPAAKQRLAATSRTDGE